MGKLKTLASDTVVYGFTTILGRMLNWLLMPFYIRTISTADYGMVVNLYSIIAVLLVLVTLGFETGYFRFVNDDNKNKLLNTLSSSVFLFGTFLILMSFFFDDFLCSLLSINIFNLLLISLFIVLIDSYNAIFFAELRYSNRSLVYSVLRLIQVVITIVFTIFFLLFLKQKVLFGFDFSTINDVAYILFANLLGSFSSTIYFVPKILKTYYHFDAQLFKTVLTYSLPLVGMGFFGVANQNIEKLLIVKLDFHEDVYTQLAIYGANYKIGVLMAIFTQSFRLAFEPFFFKEYKSTNQKDIYAQTLKYFVYFGLLIYAGVLLFLPIVNIFLTPEYYCGNVVIPFILIGQLFFGVYYSLSMWYKAIDKTYFGIIMSLVGLTVNTVLNFILIPKFGFIGAAVSTVVGYFVMMLMSFVLGNHYYPIKYPFFRIIWVTVVVVALVHVTKFFNEEYFKNIWFLFSVFSFFIILFLFAKVEKIRLRIPFINGHNRNKDNQQE